MAYKKGEEQQLELLGGLVETQFPLYISKYMRRTLLNHLLCGASTSSSLCYLALYNLPKEALDGGGGEPPPAASEISGSGYGRLNISGAFTVNTTTGSAYNTSNLVFPIATDDWINPIFTLEESITHIGLINGSQAGDTSGSLLFYGPLSASCKVHEGDTFIIPSGGLKISMDRGWSAFSGSRLLNHYLNNLVYPSPASIYVTIALYNTMPSASGWGSSEVSGGGYTRLSVGGSGSWSFHNFGNHTYNLAPIVFSQTGGTADWGKIVGFGIHDETPSINSLMLLGDVNPPVTVIGPDGFMFSVRDLKIYPELRKSEGG